MREKVPTFGMLDTAWLRTPTKSRNSVPAHIKNNFPIVDRPAVMAAFMKLNRKPVTLIACNDVGSAAVAIPFLLGAISATNSENFKLLLALKRHTQYNIKIVEQSNEIIRNGPIGSPVTLLENNSNNRYDANLMIATFAKAFTVVEEALNLSDSHLTHIIMEGFDGDNCLDMELLTVALRLVQKDENFSVILITDGLVPNSKDTVEKLYDFPFCYVDVDLEEVKQRSDRDVIVLNSNNGDIIQLEEDIYDRFDTSNVVEINPDIEESLNNTQLTDLVIDTVGLIKNFLYDEVKRENGSRSIYVVFTGSTKVMKMLINELCDIPRNSNFDLYTIKYNNCMKFLRDEGNKIILVAESVEDTFVLDGINVCIDMGISTWSSNVSSIGSSPSKNIWSDRVRMIRRANRIHEGTVAYPFNYERLKAIRARSIVRFPGYDMEMRYFFDNKEWSYRLNEERTNQLMKYAEDIFIQSGHISYRDSRYCTPMGSFCNAILQMLSPPLAKLVLCGIVCGCEDATVALASILSEESVMIECSKNMSDIMQVAQSEHLAILQTYESRYGNTANFITNNFTLTKNVERRENLIRSKIKKEPCKATPGILLNTGDMVKRVILAIAMAFGDRIVYAPNDDGYGETRFFQLVQSGNAHEDIQFQTKTKFAVDEEQIGVYYELRENEKTGAILTEMTMLPVTILGAIGNIGGRVDETTEGIYLTTNTGGLHLKMSEKKHVRQMMDIRNEVGRDVQRVALSYLQPERYGIQFKKDKPKWMEDIFPLLSYIDRNPNQTIQ